ncbi:hypothetical protein P153DRAFT_369521 [Dothidotthia symphoricarpi CBS 119687]|uniref:Uncharacterized protein n=1 Tax=Dothidotthia symphoricarpi CBS 119687 TaxID=1392245 RepID=A0A6A6A3N7_9PLEO|nr:uncharacterized protein P153DRAFT_369521 [Dothidotthia symphoricarpi CBS 119687]KAF2126166.1 hypothetical protein P153DRAFT_369521 [Dothidotthia symphoricarpi CBS 119687]
MDDQASEMSARDIYSKAKASRFTFKSASERRSKRRTRPHDDDNDDPENLPRSPKRPRSERKESSRRKHRHGHKHHSSHADRHPTSTRDGTYYDPSHRHRESLYDDPDAGDPDLAFRESLFDALADDEGAAYWEGVYGQPVHVYPTTKPGADGTLERMSDAEYTEYVRSKMWEKTHQHIVEERAAREAARKAAKQHRGTIDEDEAEREHIRQRMADSLRQGELRKRVKEGEAAWTSYTQRWDELKNSPQSDEPARDVIPWPVVSGKASRVSQEEVERFLRAAKAWAGDPDAVLKAERVRWHPDKIQQRFGERIDEQTMRSVTAVFQIVDRLWSERR